MINNNEMAISPKPKVKVTIKNIHKSKNVNVFLVTTPQGKFTVIDYKDRFGKNKDTEIYYTDYMDQIKPKSDEYRIVNAHVDEFILNSKNKTKSKNIE